jgi:hypothetical protein
MHEYFGAPTTFEVLSEGERLLSARCMAGKLNLDVKTLSISLSKDVLILVLLIRTARTARAARAVGMAVVVGSYARRQVRTLVGRLGLVLRHARMLEMELDL